MPRLTNRLNARLAATVMTPGRHADGAGLYLVVDDSGARRWVLVFQWRGARKEMGLGSFQAIPLAKARELARAAREQVAAGINPINARRAERAQEAAVTFGQAADEVLAVTAVALRSPAHQAGWRLSLKVHCAAIRAKPVAEIDTDDVLAVLTPIWARIPETASRTRGRIERVLDAAKAKGLRTGENPARWRGHLALLLPRRARLTRGHHTALPYQELPAFLAELRHREALAARALELTILTACRSGEALGGQWSEIDLDERVWIIPAERMKAGLEHRVALSTAAVALLDRLPRVSPLIFPGAGLERRLSNMAMETVLRRMDRKPITVHGFRSTFKDWAAEATQFPDELSEEALAHVVGNKVRRAYRRGDGLEKRRQLMEAWADFCAQEPGRVIQLRR